jgi:hypothetical protein
MAKETASLLARGAAGSGRVVREGRNVRTRSAVSKTLGMIVANDQKNAIPRTHAFAGTLA